MRTGAMVIIIAAAAGLGMAAGAEPGGEEADPEIAGKPLSQWVKQLRNVNKGLQLRAAKNLIEAPAELRPRMMPKMMELLKSDRENDKYVAAKVLGGCGPAARAAVPGLLPMLEGTQYERNRAAAAKALGLILKDARPDEEVEKVTGALVAVFTDNYSDVRREAAAACGTIGPAAKSCIPHLPLLFDDEAHHHKPQGGPSHAEMYMVHATAAWAAGRMGPLAAEHIDRLVSIMNNDRDISTTVVWAIGEIGAVNENVIPNLVNRLEKVLAGQGFAVGALSCCAGDLTEGDIPEYRDVCFAVLARFGARSEKAVPLMNRCITEGNWYDAHRIRNAIGAFKVLRAVGPAAKEAIPALEKAVRIEQFDDRIPAPTVEAFKKEARAALEAVAGRAAGPAAAPASVEGMAR